MTANNATVAELYRRFAPVVYRRSLKMLGQEADALDAVQDVFITVSRRLDDFRGEASPMTWIYSITTNYCLNALRGRKVRARAAETLRREPEKTAADDAAAFESRQLLQLLAAGLNQRQIEVLTYHYLDGLSQPQIGEILGISERGVRKILAKARDHAGARLASLEGKGAPPR
ncbi:MAG: sigma-70 family RNA polymerase sigma factor [Deltaproteobacteria bacterium]|nr:sigma-70 family RNA polymerase sigma factor [Deltaproteobacteria bacterium]